MPDPIGVYDSGLGGLSVLAEIHAHLPAEPVLYVADHAYCPYGNLSDAKIRERALAIGSYLVAKGARALVVACNTATAAAVDDLRGRLSIPVVGMEPAIKPAAATTKSGVIGVLATGPTLATGRFHKLVERYANGIQVLTQPCPGLVERVEAGDLDSPGTLALLAAYLDPVMQRGADVIVLGCTHYPYLRPALARLLGPGVAVLDTGAAVARQLRRVLEPDLTPGQEPGAITVVTTGSAAPVAAVARVLWGSPLPVHHAAID